MKKLKICIFFNIYPTMLISLKTDIRSTPFCIKNQQEEIFNHFNSTRQFCVQSVECSVSQLYALCLWGMFHGSFGNYSLSIP